MATTAFSKAPCSPPPKVKRPPACPDCGALECLCRPRFFAGQLLSEQDLNRLDQYIKKKNQLQNRNLHGWGVVNGLKVLCDPCGQIKVSKGYALSPCGDDIVVCEDTAVDICSLIRQCKQQDRGSIDCQPFTQPSSTGCDELEEEWVLAIRYAEFPSRGITALRGGGCACGQSSGQCQCQGNGSCGQCGSSGANCHCSSVNPSTHQAKPRSTPSECEATIICEGYQFDVYRKSEDEGRVGASDDDNNLSFGGDLAEAFSCCIKGIFGAVTLPPGQANPENINQNPTLWHQWCCRTREGLIHYFSRYPGTNCELLRALHTLVCPNPSNENFAQQMSDVADQLGLIVVEGVFSCLCLALLPPALEGTDDPRVPLATVKVRGKNCEIISVCNWTVCRKLVTTWPTMSYWCSILPFGKILREALDRLCCDSFIFGDREAARYDQLNVDVPRTVGVGATRGTMLDPVGVDLPRSAGVDTTTETTPDSVSVDLPRSGNPDTATETTVEKSGAMDSSGRVNASHRLNPQFNLDRELTAVSRFVTATMERGNKPLDPASLLNSISRFNLAGEKSAIADIESRNLPQFLLLNSLARPLVQSGLASTKADKSTANTDLMTAVLGQLSVLVDKPSTEAEALQNRVADLEGKLEQQQQLIKALQPATTRKKVTKKAIKKITKKTASKKVIGKRANDKKAGKQ